MTKKKTIFLLASSENRRGNESALPARVVALARSGIRSSCINTFPTLEADGPPFLRF